jgi:sigma-B regulation protein RsbU (phosphoserine phosphatase)
VPAKDHLLGFISLGPKRSEAPSTATDLRLLKSVAVQTGFALENTRLTAAVARETAQREKLNREVEIAREVQQRLFPQKLPPVPGLEYSGACRPALGVGGDYYDFLALPGGRLGVAIGDVSGKGIAAALMMATLQASLRGEAMRGSENLGRMIAGVNRLVFDASTANRYATFFYAEYEPERRALTYVNAGHNPPMLFRTRGTGAAVQRLEAGGTVIGLLESFPFVQDTVSLDPGDMLVAYTDGVSEAMNPEDEEWGETRMMETVERCRGLNAARIIEYVIAGADAFASGAPQHDDMTLVILNVLPKG